MITHNLLARISEASYTGVKPLKELGFNRVVKFRSGRTATKAYLAISDSRQEAVVVFRGTEKEGKDILTDLKFRKKQYKGHNVHRGFLKAYKSVQGHINKEVNKLPPNYKLYATGHSLGASLSCLYSVFGDREVVEVVGFGCPRVGDKAFCAELTDKNCTLYINNADIVTRVPKIGYFHPYDINYITSKGKVIVNPSWWKMFKDRWFHFLDRITDHRIKHYIAKV